MVKTLGLALMLLAYVGVVNAASYRIEMLIFEWADNMGKESWRSDDEGPNMTQAVGDLSDQTTDDGRLGPAAYTLRRNGYRIIKHLAWTQDVKGRSSDDWYQIHATGLNGLIRITKGRYLHVDTDFLVQGKYRATEQRRMRSAEIHYIDHPKIGILIRIDPYTPPSTGPVDR